MLTTLIRLGEQLSEEMGDWDDITDFPTIIKENEKNSFIAELVFDLDS